jgi:3-oxoacyl-[acyl-carrier protein] reductase
MDMTTPASVTSGDQLAGKVAVITGGANGIGLAIATAFVAQGASVVLGDLSHEALAAAADRLGDRCATVTGDVTDESHSEAMCQLAIERFGRLDIGVNSAGRGDYAPIMESTAEQFRSIIDLCLTGVFLSTKHQARTMVSSGNGGSIINIASLNAIQAAAGMASYCSAKAGVAQLTKVAAMELGVHQIRVNALEPGLIETNATAAFFAISSIRDDFVANAPLGRHGQPSDVADAALFLAGDASKWITGTALLVDGGGHTGRYPVLADHFAALG